MCTAPKVCVHTHVHTLCKQEDTTATGLLRPGHSASALTLRTRTSKEQNPPEAPSVLGPKPHREPGTPTSSEARRPLPAIGWAGESFKV